MGDSSGEFAVSDFKRSRDPRWSIGLSRGELLQKLAIELPVARHPPQAAVDVDSGDYRQVFVRRWICRPGKAVRPARQGSTQSIRIDWLRDVIVHACVQASLALLRQGMCGHRDNRNSLKA